MKFKKIISTLLISTLVFTSTAVAFADTNNLNENINMYSKEVVKVSASQIAEENYTVERKVSDEYAKSIVKDCNGSILATAVAANGQVIVTDNTVNSRSIVITDTDSLLDAASEVITSTNTYISESIATSVDWGNWTSRTKTVHIPKLTVAAFLAAVSVLCPYMSVAALSSVASVFIAGGYSYATVKVRTRYGTDSRYQYSQEEVTIWGRKTESGTKTHLYGPKVWSQKKSLNS